LSTALAGRGLKSIERLYMNKSSSAKLTLSGLSHVMGVLAQGVCPKLTEISMASNFFGHSAGHPIAQTLASGYMESLRVSVLYVQ